MQINNHQLAEQLWSSYTNEVLANLKLIHWLIRRYWKKLQSDAFQSIISTDHPNVVSLVKLLSSLNKLSIENVLDIINLIKKKFEHSKVFELYTSDTDNNEIKTYLEETHNAKAQQEKSKKIWVRIQGEWLYYERNIDKDLSKLLHK